MNLVKRMLVWLRPVGDPESEAEAQRMRVSERP